MSEISSFNYRFFNIANEGEKRGIILCSLDAVCSLGPSSLESSCTVLC